MARKLSKQAQERLNRQLEGKTEEPAVVIAVEQTAPIVLDSFYIKKQPPKTNKALSIILKEGKYHLVQITFNQETLETISTEVTASDPYRYEICDRFKIAAADLDFV